MQLSGWHVETLPQLEDTQSGPSNGHTLGFVADALNAYYIERASRHKTSRFEDPDNKTSEDDTPEHNLSDDEASDDGTSESEASRDKMPQDGDDQDEELRSFDSRNEENYELEDETNSDSSATRYFTCLHCSVVRPINLSDLGSICLYCLEQKMYCVKGDHENFESEFFDSNGDGHAVCKQCHIVPEPT
ncbi:uncharacterized protein N7482_010548 [Penicillium canariense]|uniref:Uncharacterized protein n=1 Tax=Penicillium canariense TaxID=189055 RepID=A0A9W9LD19_9EURO|nr:uncharacterized protein N7482_010548 [Penicillium canariense]KAJ5151296.1 hypothetical protein N7482_010548 [Penicillium canariense]